MIFRIFFSLLMFLSFRTVGNSQAISLDTARNVLYLEIAGVGGYGSLNYERILPLKKDFQLSIRAGLSTYNIRDFKANFNPDLLFPFSVNFTYGKDHKVVTGLGQTVSSVVQVDINDFNAKRKTNISSTFFLGYTYFKKGGGMMYRLVYSPVLEFNQSFRHWAGLSIGYAF